jgi:hypothetical protein
MVTFKFVDQDLINLDDDHDNINVDHHLIWFPFLESHKDKLLSRSLLAMGVANFI